MLRVSFAMMTVLLAGIPTSAWSSDVHAEICELAWDLLSDEGRRFVVDVRTDADRSATRQAFGRSCVWPDDSRHSTHRGTYEYHFLNVKEEWTETVDFQRDCPGFDCVPMGVRRFAIALSRGGNPKKRELALRFVGHFVGDLHQPLHVSHRSDLGGNRIRVELAWKRGRDARTNLHSAWDVDLPEAAGIARAQHQQLLHELRESRPDDSIRDLLTWTQESYVLAKTVAYTTPDGSRVRSGDALSEAYRDAAIPIVRQRVFEAARRLATLLDEIAAGRNRFFETDREEG